MRSELLAALEPDSLVAGRIVAEEPRRVDRVIRAVERVGKPRHPAQELASTRLSRERPEAAARQALDQVEQDRARLVDELVTVAERRNAAERIDRLEARCLLALARMNVDGGVVGACLLERRAGGEAARAGDLEELEHDSTLLRQRVLRCRNRVSDVRSKISSARPVNQPAETGPAGVSNSGT